MKTRVYQMGFDIKVGPKVTQHELISLFNHLDNCIDTFYDINGKAQEIESIGQFNCEDITQQYKSYLDDKASR